MMTTSPIVSPPPRLTKFKSSGRGAVYSSARVYCCETPLLLERGQGGRILGLRDTRTDRRVEACPDCGSRLTRDRELLREYPRPVPEHLRKVAVNACPHCSREISEVEAAIAVHVGNCALCGPGPGGFDAWLTEESARG